MSRERNNRDKMRDRWHKMKNRCYNTNYHSYHRYGGRGITVCDRWLNSLDDFIKDMGNPPFDKAEIDRIDNDKGYSPSNCRWVTHKENCNNRKTYKSKSGFTGVHLQRRTGLYSASFCVNRKSIYVGKMFKNPHDAYKYRIEKIKEYNKTHKTNIKYIEYEEYMEKHYNK